jgi:uncharacterized membrane protein
MLETFRAADDLFSPKLGCALKMEETVVEMLERLQGDELREQVPRATRACAQRASARAS